MKYVLNCEGCVEDGPSMKITPLGPAFETEENRAAWYTFTNLHEFPDCYFGLRAIE